nr:hypothetical protein [Candidatus Cloacimonadota bacterium]
MMYFLRIHTREFFALILFLMVLTPSMVYGSVDDSGTTPIELNQNNSPSGLQKAMQENRLLSRMYPLLFRDESEQNLPNSKLNYDKWNGKKIGKINIVSIDVFSPENVDSGLVKNAVDLGNYLHPSTRKRIIKDMLFFSEGDTLVVGILEKNIQYLYDQDSFSEVSFVLDEMENGDVEITVMVRDKFFLQFGGKYINRDNFNVKITDRNLFGTGLSLKNSWNVDPQNQGSIDWESSFTNPNILGTFFRGDVSWKDIHGLEELYLEIHRPFLHPLYKRAGGIDFTKTNTSPPRDTTRVKKQETGLWFARSFDFWDYPRNSYAALSLEHTLYKKRPITEPINGMPWQESIFALGSLAITKNNYGYLPRISSFLDNDYLPIGYLVELYGGYEFGEYKHRPFVGLHSAWSLFPSKDQYLFINSIVEGFVHDGAAEQAVVAIEPMYISQSKSIGQVKGRSFIRAKYVHGYNRLATESLSLNSDLLYRGNQDLQGTRLYFLSLEEDLSLPISLWGFQLTAFGFVEVAVMDDSRFDSQTRESLFSEGMGVRLRNPSLIWDFIELFVSLDHLSSKSSVNIELNLKRAFSIEDFKGRRPQRYKFQ